MRLRFAPSPTGSLHLGNARTAILNWLHARAAGGTFVLRVEDTDRARNTPAAEAALIEDLRWLGLDWDEGPDVGGPHGPYRQSERGDRYAELVGRLIEAGTAYRCFCDADRLRAEREAARAQGESWRYGGTCRALSPEVAARRVRSGEAAAVRLRTEDRHLPTFHDGLRGEVGAGETPADDFVLVRADGDPVYQFTVVADDHDMRIDHVIRGQDHLSNTPRQLLIYRALGWEPPRFTHLPLVLAADRSRLSKRHGATGVAEMRDRGILPEALLNYLVLLGWAPPDDDEVLAATQLRERWRLSDLAPTNVAFDPDKLDWLNQQHLLRLDPAELLTRAEPALRGAGLTVPPSGPARAWWERACDLVRGRAGRLDAIAAELAPILTPSIEPVADPAERTLLAAVREVAVGEPLGSEGAFRAAAKAAGGAAGLRGRALFHPLRLALTGREEGPELAHLVPLIEAGAALDLEPPVPSVGERLGRALGKP